MGQRKIFVDTNILMDIVFNREGVEASKKVMGLHMSEDGAVRVYTSMLSIVTVSYFVRRKYGQEEVRRLLKNLSRGCNIMGIPDLSLIDAVRPNSSPDFEDAIQISCAEANLCDVIVTRNIADYKGYTWIQVMSPEELA